MVSYAREIVNQIRAQAPEMQVYLSGLAMFNNAFNEAAMKDASTLLPLSFGAMLVLLAFLLGGLTATFATLVVITASVVSALGLCGHLGIPLTNANTNGPLIILTVAIANSVHIVVNFIHAARQGTANREALQDSLRVNLHPVFLASITTAIGFLNAAFLRGTTIWRFGHNDRNGRDYVNVTSLHTLAHAAVAFSRSIPNEKDATSKPDGPNW